METPAVKDVSKAVLHADLEPTLQRHYQKLRQAGLQPNVAAAYALKWTVQTAQPVDVTSLQALCEQRQNGCTDPQVAEQCTQLTCRLFSSGDALFMSLVLHCSGDADRPLPSEAETPSTNDTWVAVGGGADEASGSAESTSSDNGDAAAKQAPAAQYNKALQIDMQAVADLFRVIFDGPDSEEVVQCLQGLLTKALPKSIKWYTAETQAVIIAALLVLPQMQEVAWQDLLLAPLISLVQECQHICAPALVHVFAASPPPLLAAAVFAVQQFITIRLYCQRALDMAIATSAALLQVLHQANARLAAPASHEVFYNDVLNSADFDLREDWNRSRNAAARVFSFCWFPFMYGPTAKAQFLKFDAVDSMSEGVVSMLLSLPRVRSAHPYLVLSVRRGPELVHDALTQIRAAMQNNTLKKPLKVRFLGEQGVDEGGVAKEFFQLIIKECFAANYGMFQCLPETNVHWIRPSMLSDLSDEFELIGIIVGLAIYNAHLLGFTFASAVYRKLLGQPLSLDDLRDVHPGVHTSLKALLAYPADRVQQDMGLTFEVSHEVDFCEQAHSLVTGGADMPVTGANRRAFVDAYVRFLLVDSIAAQFDAFHMGFRRVCDSDVLRMFNAPELEAVVCGARDVDFEELKRVALYDGGYSDGSDVIAWFWDILLAFNDDQKRQFLQFVTSSERVPIGGLASLEPPFCVVKNGPHSDRLPTAHTCFNTLLLPQYESREALRDRLQLALQNSHGFGLM